MNFLQKLLGMGSPAVRTSYYLFRVRCRRCGEIIEGRVDVDNDLSADYENERETLHCRKVLMGEGRNHCYQQIEVTLTFDARRRLLERRVEQGGDFMEE